MLSRRLAVAVAILSLNAACAEEPVGPANVAPTAVTGAITIPGLSSAPLCTILNRGTVYYVVATAQLVYCDGSRLRPLDAAADGVSYLVTQTAASAEVCPAGGVVIQSGPDANADGVLDTVTAVASVCNGAQGPAGVAGRDGVNGTNGTNGTDGANGSNGADGADGTDGSDGANGNDGLNSLVALEPEPAGPNCRAGGTRIRAGLDTDRDGVLSQAETTQVSYVCVPVANTAPVATSSRVHTDLNTAVDVTLVGTDAENDPLTFELVIAPEAGTVTIAGSTATFTPSTGEVGAFTFYFKASDGVATSNAAAVTIVVGASVNGSQLLAARSDQTCSVRDDGGLLCWGLNWGNSMGLGPVAGSQPYNTPQWSEQPMGWSKVAAGYLHGCGIRNDQSLWCWGFDDNGQRGDADTEWGQYNQQHVMPGTTWREVAAGAYHTCAIATDGSLWCWGWNAPGTVGDGTFVDRTVPTRIGTATNWTSIALGRDQTCGVREDGTLWCWGGNNNGLNGHGITTGGYITSPRQVTAVSVAWHRVFAAQWHTCGLTQVGDLYCWGMNDRGQLGLGPDTATKSTPQRIGSGYHSVSLGYRFTCATMLTGAGYCWGANDEGQLGNGTQTSTNVPTLVNAVDSYWRDIVAGDGHACGRTGVDDVWCWGENTNGQVGNGTTAARWLTPQKVR